MYGYIRIAFVDILVTCVHDYSLYLCHFVPITASCLLLALVCKARLCQVYFMPITVHVYFVPITTSCLLLALLCKAKLCQVYFMPITVSCLLLLRVYSMSTTAQCLQLPQSQPFNNQHLQLSILS